MFLLQMLHLFKFQWSPKEQQMVLQVAFSSDCSAGAAVRQRRSHNHRPHPLPVQWISLRDPPHLNLEGPPREVPTVGDVLCDPTQLEAHLHLLGPGIFCVFTKKLLLLKF